MDYTLKRIMEGLDSEAIIRLMTNLGANDYKETDEYIMFPTICHNVDVDEASMKLYYYKDNKFFMCYSECGGMSIFEFLKHYYETRQIDYDWYNDVYLVAKNCSVSKELEGFASSPYEPIRDNYTITPLRKPTVYDEKILAVFQKYYPPEWLNDGISKEAMDKFNILYSISQNKIIIPHYNVNGNLIGVRGRALNAWEIERGKYMPVKIEDTIYKHELSLNLYGLYQNKENIKKTGLVFLFESEKSVLQFESFNLPHCAVASCGSNFNKFQLKLLLQECSPKEIIICYDKEELPGEDKYFEKLYGIGKKYIEQCNFSFLYDRQGLLQLKDSPSDRGEEIFKKLLKKRVIIR